MGMPATNKAVDVQLIDMFGFGADGRVHEHWGVMDLMGLTQQLGLAPAGPSA
jgi:predicted ester cyclase